MPHLGQFLPTTDMGRARIQWRGLHLIAERGRRRLTQPTRDALPSIPAVPVLERAEHPAVVDLGVEDEQ